MIEEDKVDPEELLRVAQQEESKLEPGGTLKIFFGMAAGVGKTYAMLEAAHDRLKAGDNVMIGTISSHGRKDTENLIKGVPIIPEKWISYKDTVFEEMDLETILEKKPTIVLVDELAHTNIPGSRHAKRWQDVIEILDAGIHVYTTLNVQHVESRKDIVEAITGVQIRETVPDLILERATTIELIDLAPSELLKRLKDGKVYLGNQPYIAAQHFFKEDKLMALREIALRFTAEKVDHDLHAMIPRTTGWKTREKLMVAISPSSTSQLLIRTARRRAFELDIPWIAVYVDTGKILTDEEQTQVTNYLNLAQELGAEVITIQDLDIAGSLERLAKQKNITQLVIGRSSKHHFFQKNLLDRLEEENKELDLLILRQHKQEKVNSGSHLFEIQSPLYEYGIVLLCILLLNALGYLIFPWVGYKALGFIFLLGTLGLSFIVGQGPIFFAAISSTLSWTAIFTPPVFELSIGSPENRALNIIYFCTSLMIGLFTNRIRKQDIFLKKRAKKLESLYEIEREIANASHYQDLRAIITARIESILNGQFDILLKKEDSSDLIFDTQVSILDNEKERAAATWAFQNRKITGWSTSILPSAKCLYIPIVFSDHTLGIVVYSPKRERLLSTDELNLLQTVAQRLGVYLERGLFEEKMANQSYIHKIEQMQGLILQSITKGFYKPLHKMREAIVELKKKSFPAESQPLLNVIETRMHTLLFIIENLLSSADVQAGFAKLKKENQDIQVFIELCCKEIAPILKEHTLTFSFPKQPCFLLFDTRLMRLAVKNLLVHAAITAFSSAPIYIVGKEKGNYFEISIIHKGTNIASELLSHIFDKNYQHPDSQKEEEKGGPGLALVKSVMEIHQGNVEVCKLHEGKIAFSLLLPL